MEDIKYTKNAKWSSQPPPSQLIYWDMDATTDTLTAWLKLILITNFLNAHVLSFVLSYAWTTLIRRFYTTIEFDEFDSTFCERISTDSGRTMFNHRVYGV